MMTAKELMDQLNSIGEIIALEKVEIRIETPTGRDYPTSDIGFRPEKGWIAVIGKAKTRGRS